jgi:hypothetical protein
MPASSPGISSRFSELISGQKHAGRAEDFDRALRELQDKGLLVTGTATP